MAKSILFILVALMLFHTAHAAVSAKGEKDNTAVLKGEGELGQGYKFYFNEAKDSSLHLHGFTRMYTYFSEDVAKKLRMPYFRFYVDGQKDSQWSFHTRFDIWTNFSNPDNGQTTGIYFARAYTTYKHNDIFSIDAGRNLNFLYKYDVLLLPELEVGLGITPKLNFGQLQLMGSFIYMDETQRAKPSAKEDPENYYYGLRAAYEHVFGKDFKLSYGLAWQESDRKVGFVQWLPDITIQFPNTYYIYSQLVYIEQAKDSMENHLEIGKDITEKFTMDAYLHTTKTEQAKRVHDVGVEYIYKFTPAFLALFVTEYAGAWGAARSKNQKFNVSTFLEYKF